MKLTRGQFQALQEGASERFRVAMAGHLGRFFPRQCDALGPQGVDEAIRSGVERAGKYGITQERDVAKFIDLIFAFGARFDEAPWAAEILSVQGEDGSAKINHLYDVALEAIERAAGTGRWSAS